MSTEKLEKVIALVAFLFLWAVDPLDVGIPHWYLLVVIAFWALLRGGKPPD